MIAAASSVVIICRLLFTLGSVTSFFALSIAASADANAARTAVCVAAGVCTGAVVAVTAATGAATTGAAAAVGVAAAVGAGSGAFFHANNDRY